MHTHSRRATLLTAILVVATITTIPLFGGTAAAQEETANDYFETFRSMEGTEAYDEYDELETVRTFAVSQTQVTGELTAAERAEFEAVIGALTAFDRAYVLAEDGDYESSLAAAENVSAYADDLEEYDQTQATLVTLALTRFYERLGDGLYEEADATNGTPERIEYLDMTATAYERADMPEEATQFRVQAEQLSAEFERDRETIATAQNTSATFLEDCADCADVQAAVSANGFETFAAYQDAEATHIRIRDARERAAHHGLADREDALAAMSDDVGQTRTTLAIASVVVLIGYGVVVGLLGTIVAGRLFVWRRTYDAARVGSVVSVGDSDV
ncbi:hypothetical protein [Natrinema salaciae]|uniref:Uncharacterized protein n=1 Tax=Natrinema salaciae TaxID=1186196 RepID=A0A1H9NQ28_9EURY|nr:hypothetical protein [Natrinema salaciae]SER37463.1 hypothetical protein SAMN04489841_3671 [Natrinema salaciae]